MKSCYGNFRCKKCFHSFAAAMEMKERILQKSEELFKRYGIRSVTMDEISYQLGISKKTLYQSFADKEEIVRAVFDNLMNDSKAKCIRAKATADNAIHEEFLAFDHVAEMFNEMNTAILFDLHKYHPNVYVKFNEYKWEFLYGVIKENIERGIREELYRKEINVEILTRFRIESGMLPFNTDVFPQSKKDLTGVERAIMEHFLYGLATTKGTKLIQKYIQERQKQQ